MSFVFFFFWGVFFWFDEKKFAEAALPIARVLLIAYLSILGKGDVCRKWKVLGKARNMAGGAWD